MKILLYFISVAVYCVFCEGLSPQDCQMLPAWHCVIEYAARARLPHTDRYFYQWKDHKCYLMRWSAHCAIPQSTNNFGTRDECMDTCGGWA